MGSDPNVSMHELVREVLKQDQEFEDYYLDNISENDENEAEAGDAETEAADQSLPVDENIADVQARLGEYLNEDQKQLSLAVHNKEATALETIERLKNKLKKRLDRSHKTE